MPLAQNGQADRLGQHWGNGLVRGVRELTFMKRTGFRDVDSNAEFLPGQLLKLGTDTNGKVVVTNIDDKQDTPVGMALITKGAPFYLPYEEEVAWPSATGQTITLSKPNVKEVIVIDAGGNVLSQDTPGGGGESYEVQSAVNGILQVNSVGDTPDVTPDSPAAGAFVTIRYRYKDTENVTFDQTLASGKVALIEDNGDVALEVYDTSVQYAIGDPVYLTDAGIITSASAGSPTEVGFVTRPPTADDVTLQVKLTAF